MSTPFNATEIVFLPGFDGAAELRSEFVDALRLHHPTRAVGYPDRPLESLNAYARVAARWASRDPHVAGLVLCGAFARVPVPWAALGASMPAMAQFLAANFLNPMSFLTRDPARQRWSVALAATLRSMRQDVIAERLSIIATEDVSPELAALRIPVVIVHFDGDLVIGSEARVHLESVCHNADVVRVPGPHFAIETRPRESAAAIAPRLASMFDKPLTRTGT